MKEASKMYCVMLKSAGLYPFIDFQAGKILPRFDVNNVFEKLGPGTKSKDEALGQSISLNLVYFIIFIDNCLFTTNFANREMLVKTNKN